MKGILVAMPLMAAMLLVIGGVAWAATVECQVGVLCIGTDEPDKLIGTDKPDQMVAGQDNDRLLGRRGGDTMWGDHPGGFNPDTSTDGDDELFANNGEDTVIGLGGSDLLRGGGRADLIDARENGRGYDSVNPGEDTVIADGGKDVIFARDRFFDTIDCGDNVDTVFFDEGLDLVADNCEIHNPPPPLTSEAAKAQEELDSLSRR